MTKEQRATLDVFISGLLFSIGGLCVKVIPWSAVTINGMRSLISVVILLIYFYRTGHRPVFSGSVFVGAASMAGVTTLYCVANKLTTAANTIILQFTAPIFVILLTWVFFRQKPKKNDVAACAVVFAGILLFFLDSVSAGGMLGNVCALLSGVCYAGVFMMNTFPGADPLSSVLFGQAACAVTQAPFILRETVFSPQAVIAILALGIFQLALAYLFMTRGLRYVSAVTASLTTAVEPVLNPVLVAVFYRETVSGLSLAGAVIVFAGVIGYSLQNALKTEKQKTDKQKNR